MPKWELDLCKNKLNTKLRKPNRSGPFVPLNSLVRRIYLLISILPILAPKSTMRSSNINCLRNMQISILPLNRQVSVARPHLPSDIWPGHLAHLDPSGSASPRLRRPGASTFQLRAKAVQGPIKGVPTEWQVVFQRTGLLAR